MILASYFIGYLISEVIRLEIFKFRLKLKVALRLIFIFEQIPGGYLSMKIGPKLVLAGAFLIGSSFTIILPFFARFHYIALAVCRFIIGLAHVRGRQKIKFYLNHFLN